MVGLGGEGWCDLGVQCVLPYLRSFLEAQFMDWEKEVEISHRPTNHKGLQTPGDVQQVGRQRETQHLVLPQKVVVLGRDERGGRKHQREVEQPPSAARGQQP